QIEQLVVGRVLRRRLAILGLIRPDDIRRAEPELAEQSLQLRFRRRRLQVLDDVEIDLALLEELERLARFRAAGVVVDSSFQQRLLVLYFPYRVRLGAPRTSGRPSVGIASACGQFRAA